MNSFTMMSAVSLKPSAILEATFSATWLGLSGREKLTEVREPWLKGNVLTEPSQHQRVLTNRNQ